MSMKGGPSDIREIDRWDDGVGWIAYPDEDMQRASHALVDDDGVWLLDPVDAPDLDGLLADYGDVAGVVVCLDRHKRDAASLARRHDVSVHVPNWMTGVVAKLDAPVERFGSELAETGFASIRVRKASVPPWQEVALYDDDGGTLYVPEALGTAGFFRARGERLGVHPMLRLFPPRDPLSGCSPERVLVGHGEGIMTDGAAAMRDALAGARRRAPSAYAKALAQMF